MKPATRTAVRKRAAWPCEYCRLHEDDDVFTFHVEHIVSIKHGGGDDLENLALACQHCNLHKGANLTGIDPESGEITRLFHPRQQHWTDHFDQQDCRLMGTANVGRTTVQVLKMNDPDRLRLRTLASQPAPPNRR